ncbi:selenium-dependent molybdenum cofactor biosynthesis protein YqeB [Fusobacterium hominis]|jgi:xanthine dehydrogenase accessory factor|uniref:selenium-dependent molybdenum cofactor biosynthesis protein YqeB n=1 Tax=Fusobacterium hominis TaxID=2764326 RepID=UPI0022E05CE5|nr:selenium-dependent molybdenum cofactor biosynthesis protein YqeB [Fusobacterium hominis]
MKNIKDMVVVVRGGGDIATGSIQKLYRTGFKVLILEIDRPSAIRRKVAFCEAVYDNVVEVENIVCRRCSCMDEIEKCWSENEIPLAVDPDGEYIDLMKPDAVIDAILAKKNMGTKIKMAPIVIGLGPGFDAGVNCHIAIETMRGHNLGRLIFKGPTMKNTGVPGIIKGIGKERVIYSPIAGIIKNIKDIGDIVAKDEVLATIDDVPVRATISGVLRGIIRDGYEVSEKFKIADIDPRIEEQQNCYTISDKARAVGGATLEAVLYLINNLSKE